VVATARSRWRWIALAYPALTTLAVVVTANHFWLDGIAAAALLALAIGAQRAAGPAYRAVRRSVLAPAGATATADVPAAVGAPDRVPVGPAQARPRPAPSATAGASTGGSPEPRGAAPAVHRAHARVRHGPRPCAARACVSAPSRDHSGRRPQAGLAAPPRDQDGR
jgi:hypothetical protein